MYGADIPFDIQDAEHRQKYTKNQKLYIILSGLPKIEYFFKAFVQSNTEEIDDPRAVKNGMGQRGGQHRNHAAYQLSVWRLSR